MEIILKDFCIKGKENCIKYILLSKVDDLYSAYIQSDRYKKEIELMKKEYGIKMTFLYQFVADNFLTYYYYSKPHKKNFKKFDMKIFNNNNLKKKMENKKENGNPNMIAVGEIILPETKKIMK